jgi:hypothetical protein
MRRPSSTRDTLPPNWRYLPLTWDKTVYITDNAAGQRLVNEFTHSLAKHVAQMQIADHTEITLTA